MRDTATWQGLGWRHDVWTLVRFFRSLRGNAKADWLKTLVDSSSMEVEQGAHLEIEMENVTLLLDYIRASDAALAAALLLLRTEKAALAHCTTLGVTVSKTKTQSQDHHQSSKALVGAVTSIAATACKAAGVSLSPNPQRRCVWSTSEHLHVSARNLDGAVPGLVNPKIVWEIKEYWGQTKGGSKMSDAVYECQLVGREIREYEEESGSRVQHFVMLDGKDQWEERKSDLLRFIDLEYQGMIDRLFIGQEVETEFPAAIAALLPSPGT